HGAMSRRGGTRRLVGDEPTGRSRAMGSASGRAQAGRAQAGRAQAGRAQAGHADEGPAHDAGRRTATEAFVAHRNLLFTVAYEMLGSAADAEDVLQETWMRWAGVDHAAVLDERAYLVRIVARQALMR